MYNSSYKIYEDEKRLHILKRQRELYLQCGLKDSSFTSQDIFISEKEYIHYTEINVNPNKQKETFVLVHGLGACNSIFFKLIKQLAPHFKIIAFDMPGFALSYRFKVKNRFTCTDSCIDFYVEQFNRFFNKLGLNNFILGGHSLGSFLSTHYFNAFPNRVKKLMIFSPAGFNPINDDSELEFKRFLQSLPFISRHLTKRAVNRMENLKKGPLSILKWDFLKKWFVRRFLTNKRFEFDKQEAKLQIDIYSYFAELPEDGASSIGYLFKNRVKSEKPLIDILERFKYRINDIKVFYGEFDTMDQEVTKQNVKNRDINIEIIDVDDSDHMLICQNIDKVTEEILKSCQLIL